MDADLGDGMDAGLGGDIGTDLRDHKGADLGDEKTDHVKMLLDQVEFGGAQVDVPESSKPRRGINMGAKHNKNLKMKDGKIWVQYNSMGVPTGLEALHCHLILVYYRIQCLYCTKDWRKVLEETKKRMWISVLGRFLVHPASRKEVLQSIGGAFRQ